MKAKLQVEEKIKFDRYIEVEVESEEKLEELDRRLDRDFEELDEMREALGSVEGVKIVDVCQDESGSVDVLGIIDWYDKRD